MSDFLAGLQTSKDALLAEAAKQKERKRLQMLAELLSTEAGQQDLVNILSESLPVGGCLFIGNANVYKKTAIADNALRRLSDLRKALTYMDENGNVQYCSDAISKVLLAWFFGNDIRR